MSNGTVKRFEDACSKMIKIDSEYKPNKENFEIYDESFSYYKKLFNDLLSLFDTTTKE
ncbi:unnamed protein product [marine sediment metagenome]|uniref:Uncharacterized protein n=1 Tax=marine sediment metagenome TaxID=412755 RepID=X1Q2N5_9ZZZZ